MFWLWQLHGGTPVGVERGHLVLTQRRTHIHLRGTMRLCGGEGQGSIGDAVGRHAPSAVHEWQHGSIRYLHLEHADSATILHSYNDGRSIRLPDGCGGLGDRKITVKL